MKVVRLTSVAAFGLLAFGLAGCGGGSPKYVKVSGVVKINGVPYGEAVVVFSPQGSRDNNNPGKASSAYTDKDGRFVLKVQGEDNKEGALVGTHLVRIMTKGNDVSIVDPTVGSPDGGGKGRVDPIPAEWNANSTKTFEVPADGTDKADFDIVTKKK